MERPLQAQKWRVPLGRPFAFYLHAPFTRATLGRVQPTLLDRLSTAGMWLIAAVYAVLIVAGVAWLIASAFGG